MNIYPLDQIPPIPPPRYLTGMDYWDGVLGGGLVAGSALIVAGSPGSGKSTILAQVAYRLASEARKTVLYVAGEENKEQIKMRTERMGINSGQIYLTENTEVEEIFKALEEIKPEVVILDSLQMLYSPFFKTGPGTPTQMRYALQTLVKAGKSREITMIFVGHSTKSGYIAGLQTLQHAVDVVLFISMNEDGTRLLRANKNRFGSIEPTFILYMEEGGLFDYPEIKTPFGQIKNINLTEAQIYELSRKTKWGPFILFSLAWLKEQAKRRPEFKTSNGTFTLTSALIDRILNEHSLMKPIVSRSLKWLEKEGEKL